MPRAKIKTAMVTLRMPPHTKEVLKRKAADANMTLTNYLCICGLGKEIVQVNGLDAILSELKAQGRNLNQLTTLTNMGRIQFVRGDEIMDALCQTPRAALQNHKGGEVIGYFHRNQKQSPERQCYEKLSGLHQAEG